MSTTFSVTLSRAHKISERLKTKGNQLLTEAAVHASAATVMGTSQSLLERLHNRGDSVAKTLDLAQRYLRGNAAVRAVISRENEVRGISARLAQLDAVNKLVASYKSILDSAQTGTLMLSELADYKPMTTDSPVYGGISVNVVRSQDVENLKASLDALQREAVLLADEIAEANAARVNLTLDEDLATFATGAA